MIVQVPHLLRGRWHWKHLRLLSCWLLVAIPNIFLLSDGLHALLSVVVMLFCWLVMVPMNCLWLYSSSWSCRDELIRCVVSLPIFSGRWIKLYPWRVLGTSCSFHRDLRALACS